MTCKDNCFHYEACKFYTDKTKFKLPKNAENCSDFKDKSKIVELPCKVGDRAYRVFLDGIREETVLRIKADYVMDNLNQVTRIITTEYSPYTPQYINNIIFFTKKEAEARLKELQNGTT